jgi:Cu/Ag efflux protein CusF
MKKMIAIVVSLLFVLSVAGLSFAAEQKAAAPAETKKEAVPAKAEEKAPAKIKHMRGEVVAVDAKAKTLTVKGKKGEMAFSVDEKAAAKLADVKTGDKVAVKYKEMNGKNIATSVAGKQAAEKKMEKKEAAPAAPKAEEKKPAAPAEKKKTGGY